jgi:hypothetical protein
MYAVDGLADNNNNKAAAVIIKELRIDARYMSVTLSQLNVRKKKRQQLFVVYAVWFVVGNVVN